MINLVQSFDQVTGKQQSIDSEGQAFVKLHDVTLDNPLPVTITSRVNVKWKTDIDFSSATQTNTEIKGTGVDAYVQLKEIANEVNNVPFTTPTDYTYDNTKIDITGGICNLKPYAGYNKNFDFTTPSDYTYSASKIEVVSDVGRLIGDPSKVHLLYHLNETSGAVADDYTANNRDGTVTGSPAWGTGKLNNCLTFTGSTQYINSGSACGFERTQAFSFECWFYATSAPTVVTLGGKYKTSPENRGWLVLLNGVASKVQPRFYIGTTASLYIDVKTNATFDLNTWHHLVVTYAGDSNASNVNIYVNGNLEAKTVDSNTLNATTINSGECWFAGQATLSARAFLGKMDEIVVYETALSSGNVTTRYNSGNGSEVVLFYYDILNPAIQNAVGYAFASPITVFSELSTIPANTGIKYNVSSDDGVTWKYWTGSAWANVPTTQNQIPSSLSVTVGTINSGNLASIQTLDGNVLSVQEVTGTPGFTILVNFSSILAVPDILTVYGYYNGNPAHTVNVEIWNFVGSAWVTLGTIPSSSAVITQYDFTVTGTKSNYLSNGVVQTRINHTSNGVGSHLIALDFVTINTAASDSYIYNSYSNTVTNINANIITLATSGTFKFKAFLSSVLGTGTPLLDNVNVSSPSTYTIGAFEVVMNTDIQPVQILSWLSATETVSRPLATDLTYQFSTDSGVTYNGTWLTVGQLQTQIQAIINPVKLRFKFLLSTISAAVTPAIDNLQIVSVPGLYTSGNIEGAQYTTASMPRNQLWSKIEFNTDPATGATIEVYARAGDVSGSLGAYEGAFISGQNPDLNGKYVQWKVVFTGNSINSCKLHDIALRYILGSESEVSP